MCAAVKLVENFSKYCWHIFPDELSFLQGRKNLKEYDIYSLVSMAKNNSSSFSHLSFVKYLLNQSHGISSVIILTTF